MAVVQCYRIARGDGCALFRRAWVDDSHCPNSGRPHPCQGTAGRRAPCPADHGSGSAPSAPGRPASDGCRGVEPSSRWGGGTTRAESTDARRQRQGDRCSPKSHFDSSDRRSRATRRTGLACANAKSLVTGRCHVAARRDDGSAARLRTHRARARRSRDGA
jgi:hypothetical protein